MTDPKEKQKPALREPKAKKPLGLTVRQPLRMPHDDLIQPESLPSPTRQSSMPSQSIAPQRDFTRFANSIHREAVPAGLFTGKSKQLYDCLYSLTRGAIVPARTVRISRPNLMKKAGIGARVTFEANVSRLVAVGLVTVRQITGEHEGNEYTVFLPEEVSSMPSQGSHTSQSRYAQKVDGLVSLESRRTRHTLSVDSKAGSAESKTSFKTNTKDDDEAAQRFFEILRATERELTGAISTDPSKWEDLARVLAAELRDAASKTGAVSSVPAFLAAHLKRRLKHASGAGKRRGSEADAAVDRRESVPTAAQRLTENEIAEQARIIKELIEGGYTIEQAQSQFGGSMHPEDWEKIKEQL